MDLAERLQTSMLLDFVIECIGKEERLKSFKEYLTEHLAQSQDPEASNNLHLSVDNQRAIVQKGKFIVFRGGINGVTQDEFEGSTGKFKSNRMTVYAPTLYGILPAYVDQRVRDQNGMNFVSIRYKDFVVPRGKSSTGLWSVVQSEDTSLRPSDDDGEVIPYIFELVDQAGDYYRKQNWRAKRCLYCQGLIGPYESDEVRHLQGVKDDSDGTWIHPPCSDRLEQGERLGEPPRRNPAIKLVKIDVHTKNGIHYIE